MILSGALFIARVIVVVRNGRSCNANADDVFHKRRLEPLCFTTPFAKGGYCYLKTGVDALRLSTLGCQETSVLGG